MVHRKLDVGAVADDGLHSPGPPWIQRTAGALLVFDAAAGLQRIAGISRRSKLGNRTTSLETSIDSSIAGFRFLVRRVHLAALGVHHVDVGGRSVGGGGEHHLFPLREKASERTCPRSRTSALGPFPVAVSTIETCVAPSAFTAIARFLPSREYVMLVMSQGRVSITSDFPGREVVAPGALVLGIAVAQIHQRFRIGGKCLGAVDGVPFVGRDFLGNGGGVGEVGEIDVIVGVVDRLRDGEPAAVGAHLADPKILVVLVEERSRVVLAGANVGLVEIEVARVPFVGGRVEAGVVGGPAVELRLEVGARGEVFGLAVEVAHIDGDSARSHPGRPCRGPGYPWESSRSHRWLAWARR